MVADLHLASPPAAGDCGHQIAADAAMQIEDEGFVHGTGRELPFADGDFGQAHPLRKVRCELLVAQNAELGFEVSGGGMRWASRSRM